MSTDRHINNANNGHGLLKGKKRETFLLVLLWPLIVMPKTFQFAVLLCLCCSILIAKGSSFATQKLPVPIIFILLGCMVHSLSIILQCAQGINDFTRVFAAINTVLIWLIAIIFFLGVTSASYSEDEFDFVYRWVVIDFIILFCIYLFSLISKSNTFTFGGYTLYLRRLDYLASGATVRFAGFMETVLGPGHLYCITSPILVLGSFRSHRSLRISLATLIIGYYLVLQTHSRIGLVVCGLVFAISVLGILCSASKGRDIYSAIAILLGILLFVLLCLNVNNVIKSFEEVFNSRAGSNSARFGIYRKSIEKTMNESPIIGIGIKYMLGNFPYGSHCTYIGLLYKSGILGAVFFLLGLFGIINQIIRNMQHYFRSILPGLIAGLYFGLLVFADLDASNWVICLAFVVWGFLSSPAFVSVANRGEGKSHGEAN